MAQLANLAEMLFFGMVIAIVLTIWFGIVINFVYSALQLIFGKGANEASTEPGQSKLKAKKPKFTPEAEPAAEMASDAEPELHPVRASATSRVRTAPANPVEADAPEERPDYSQRMADEFDAQTVSA